MASGKALVIVESPAKAKTISRFLGAGFVVESSIGHIRDLPQNAAEIPEKHKTDQWARLGVDVDHGFKPLYVVPKEKKQQVGKLKTALKDASELYLATDEDREGESIAWHLLEVLGPKIPVKRMVFHEITPHAIEEAVQNWRELDRKLVDAQEARRILDRLYGYEVSPVLWKKVMPKLSAGRVQSVATRVLVERERARMRFRSASYWDLEATLEATGQGFKATLVELGGTRLASGKDFNERGELVRAAAVVLDEAAARGLADRLHDAPFVVRSVEEKPFRRSPYAPFMTSTLQQEASRKLRFSAKRTMQVAQRLYENGYITYMRTDSTTLSETALTAARQQATELYGREYVPDAPRRYEKKVKNAQEAHEAIRPAGDTFRLPDDVSRELGPDEFRLYDLIWKRTIASQMADARGQSVQVRIGAISDAGDDAEFAASGKVITFPGFWRAYVEGADDPDAELEDREVRLPAMSEGDAPSLVALDPSEHRTKPPDRFTEASLVKTLEEMGVGRPSTYASIIGTILDRGYAWTKGSALVPSFTAFAVVALLEQHFTNLVDYEFTARMEDDLDRIANGEEQSQPWLARFYFGNGAKGLKDIVHDRLGEIDAREVNEIPIGMDENGMPVAARVGRYGPYVQRGDDKASIPEGIAPDELTVEKALEFLAAPSGDKVLGSDPDSGLTVLARAGRYGPYVQLGEAEGKERPRTASLFKTMSLDDLSLDQALRLLQLPRIVGADPSDGKEIVAQNGRYGPYLSKDKDTRSLTSEEQLFTITLDEALSLFAQPKARRGRGAASVEPLRRIGPDPVSGAEIVLKEGRFGPYVTDGETNASLRKDDEIESLTLQRAAELLQDRRDRGPAKPARGKKAAKSSRPAKKRKKT
ncbi:MAG: type I DNA topoisomerase [Actinomycetota bacterium]|nr:type I DNA topoisomerase [Actinomycetota bacterium]